MIPAEIDRKALLAAARYIETHGVPVTRRSWSWDVVVDGKPLPPKYLISVAARIATGKAWPAARFITTEARAYLTKHGFTIHDKGDSFPVVLSPQTTAILLRWKDKAAYGFIDVLPLDFFSAKTRQHVEHEVRGPNGPLSVARCNIKTDSKSAELDYEPFGKFNKQKGNELGVTRLTFEDADRTTIAAVEWKPAGDDQFVTMPFDVLEYQIEIEPPYVPPKKGAKKVLRPVRERPGQARFRKRLKAAYGHTCCITGCNIAEALEGAHIDPYLSPTSNNLRNGLLIRKDLHALLDRRLIGIEPKTRTVRLTAVVDAWPGYSHLNNSPLLPPKHSSNDPDQGALERQWAQFTTINRDALTDSKLHK